MASSIDGGRIHDEGNNAFASEESAYLIRTVIAHALQLISRVPSKEATHLQLSDPSRDILALCQHRGQAGSAIAVLLEVHPNLNSSVDPPAYNFKNLMTHEVNEES